MKLVFVTLVAILAPSVAAAECKAPLTVSDLGALSNEDQQILDRLAKIENQPGAKTQSEAEAAIPIEAFGGEGECSTEDCVSGGPGDCGASPGSDGN